MTFPRIIAITGMKRAGKDTVAEILQKCYGYTNIKVASTLKDVVKIMFNMNNEQVEGDLKEVVDGRWGITPRQAMQFIGTEMVQYKMQELLPDIGRNFWMKQLCSTLQSNLTTCYAISDVRFVHEVEALRREFGHDLFVLKVVRSGLDSTDTHPSEKEWILIPHNAIITNDGTLEDLTKKVRCIHTHHTQLIL